MLHMIKFFRKIRKKLSDDNKPLKYMRYAIGEIVLVVIGILIALQINNWNDNGLKKEQLNTFFVRLAEDLQNDKATLDGKRIHYQKWTRRNNHIPKLCGIDPVTSAHGMPMVAEETGINDMLWEGPYPDSVDLKFFTNIMKWTGSVRLFKTNKSTITEMQNTGIYSEIKNGDLKKELNQYYYMIEEFDVKSIVLANQWSQTLIDDGLFSEGIGKMNDPREFITKNPKRISLLKHIIIEENWKSTFSEDLMRYIDSLIPKLKEELNRLS